MSRFTTRGLGLLDRLYQFAGASSTAPVDFDIATPIQPVHDVSRLAELGLISTGRLAGGYLFIDQDNAHAIAGSIENTVDNVYNSIPAEAATGRDVWLWLMQSWLNATANNLTNAQLSLGIVAAQGTPFPIRDVMLEAWTAVQTIHDPEGTTTIFAGVALGGAGVSRPLFIPPESDLGFRSTTTGASTVRFTNLFWVGPVGVYPPGMR